MRREPAVAGQFYSYDKDVLKNELKKFFNSTGASKTGDALSIVCPHAGYMYSGAVAAYSYNAIKKQGVKTAIILGPNHGGMGAPVSIYPAGEWETPLGKMDIDSKIAEEISGDKFALDESAHIYEHSIEVQLPFLQYLFKDIKIVPICIMDQRLAIMKELGEKLANTLRGDCIVIASTDFSHYIPNEKAYEKDLKAIDAIKKLDENHLLKIVRDDGLSMCGYGPVAAAIIYSRLKGATKGELLKYMTSGDVTGDKSSVVGYGSLALMK
jgi:AmmeMemoRadiSam system protein B